MIIRLLQFEPGLRMSGTENTAHKPANDKSKLTVAVSAVTGKLFCAYHGGHSDATTGAYRENGRRRMWMCGNCIALRSKLPK